MCFIDIYWAGNKVCGINMGATCGSFILKPSHGSYLKQTCIYTSIPLKALMWCDAYNSIFLVLSFRALQDFFSCALILVIKTRE